MGQEQKTKGSVLKGERKANARTVILTEKIGRERICFFEIIQGVLTQKLAVLSLGKKGEKGFFRLNLHSSWERFFIL